MRKAIAIDFDGCLCTDEYPSIGQPNWAVINRAKAEQLAGAGLILWTCREGKLLQEAVDACQGWDLIFDSVNESLPDWIEEFKTRPRKIGASEYWDDKAVSVRPNPPLTLDELRQMDGEPVWLHTFSSVQKKTNIAQWAIFEVAGAASAVFVRAGCNARLTKLFSDYGKTWLAYSHKPKEGSKC